jgi:hypothetical protein
MFKMKSLWATLCGAFLYLSVGLARAADSVYVADAKTGIEQAKGDGLSVGGTLLIMFAALFGLYLVIGMLKKK